MKPVIDIQNFRKTYKKKTVAVDNISLQVNSGTFFGFIGPNGAGKTTTVNHMVGLLKPTADALYLFGEKITFDSYEYKRRIGMVLERPLYLEKLTGKEYLHFVGEMFELDDEIVKQRTNELLEFLELKEKKDKLIETYSAGMKKKISLAAALIHDPDLLILDEPFEGIDAVSAKQIRDNLQAMIKRGKTIFLTSHALDVVEKLCDEIAIIHHGKLLFQGSMEELCAKYNGSEAASLDDIFQGLISSNTGSKTLSWLQDE